MSWIKTSYDGKKKKRHFRIVKSEFEWRDSTYHIQELKTTSDNKVSIWIDYVAMGKDTPVCYDTLEEAKEFLEKLTRIKTIGATTIVYELEVEIGE